MGYCYVLDIELMDDKLQEANRLVITLADLFRKHGANVEAYAPHTGNVHRLFAIFRFETLSEYEELMKRAGEDEELAQVEHQFHSCMKNPVYNLYSTL